MKKTDNDIEKLKKQTIVKGQINEILTKQESRHLSRPDVFYFFATAHFLKQLPTHIALIAKAPQANAEIKACQRAKFSFALKTSLKIFCILDKIVQTD